MPGFTEQLTSYEKNTIMKFFISLFLLMSVSTMVKSSDGHELWLRNKNPKAVNVVSKGKSQTLVIARDELINNWQGEAGATVTLKIVKDKTLKGDGFKINNNLVSANTETGLLYGVYELLRRQQTGQPVTGISSNPSYQLRILNHWDNPNGTIERGYAGYSIFWRKGKDSLVVTEKDKILWKEYARANASIGINGTVLNNVNASPDIITADYLLRVKAIADIMRPYGIKVYLSIKFSSPALLGGLSTSDPLNAEVVQWWEKKVKEIYATIPDFGGFLVKANSEGQPGPQDFGRTHADGANMLADILKPYNGIVMWRAFVYSPEEKDRAKQAYLEFMPFDGQFRDNVIIQVKNGPVDFQPREPFSPLFGAMKHTSVMAELQITQEYLGHSIHLVYLAPMWEELFNSDTYQEGPGSTVAKCTDGSVFRQKYTAIAGVANIGLDANWCGHHFAQSNWYAFGRLAWNNALKSDEIADEWIRLTFSRSDSKNMHVEMNDWQQNFLVPVKDMMLRSREAAVKYMMPLGLHHIFAGGHHYGPGPWEAPRGVRPDWTPYYYHRADTLEVGFDRTRKGTNAVDQYHEPLASQFDDPSTCPEMFLLWFHRLPWTYTMKSGRTLWDELCWNYEDGLHEVRDFQKIWDKTQPYVDAQRYTEVQSKLRRHYRDAQIWKDACLLYFQQHSRMPIPYEIERPVNDLKDLMNIRLGWLHHN